jgi:hypothetical protein
MPEVSPSLFLAQLFRDYLSTEESQMAGIPDALNITVMDSGKTPDFPSLVVAAKEEKSRGLCKTVDVDLLLLTWLRAPEAVESATETTRQQASEWLNAIDARLQNRTAFKTWLATLEEERLEYWTFRKNITWQGEQTPVRDKEAGTVFYALSFTCHLWWERGSD